MLHGRQEPPDRKKPGRHVQSQASAPYGFPAEAYFEFAGAFVQGTHCPLADAVHAERYEPTAQDVVSQATQELPTLKYPATQLVWQLAGSPVLPALE